MRSRGRSLPWRALLALVALGAGCGVLRHPADGKPGTSFRDGRLLDPDPPRLVVEVDRLDGAEPRKKALDAFARSLAFYVDKPGGIEIVLDETIPAEEWDGTPAGLRRIAREHRRPPPDGAAAMYVLYATEQQKYRGYCYRAGELADDVDVPVVVVFARRLRSILWVTGTAQEHAVLVHEAGHALGLVTEPSHRDRGHCTAAWCALYRTVDPRSALVWALPALFAGRLPLHYCAACRRDLWPGGRAPGLRGVPGLPTPERPGCDPVFADDDAPAGEAR